MSNHLLYLINIFFLNRNECFGLYIFYNADTTEQIGGRNDDVQVLGQMNEFKSSVAPSLKHSDGSYGCNNAFALSAVSFVFETGVTFP